MIVFASDKHLTLVYTDQRELENTIGRKEEAYKSVDPFVHEASFCGSINDCVEWPKTSSKP
jgi:hypothetical protein